MRCRPVVLGLSVLLVGAVFCRPSAAIEAVEGKRYVLDKRHGPWMIMVASLMDEPKTKVVVEDGRAKRVPNPHYREGHSAQQVANGIVYDLRKKGIPAYTYRQEAQYERVATPGRMAELRARAFAAQKASIVVMAGNYKSSKSNVAQKTLKFVKRFQPETLRPVKVQGNVVELASGGTYRKTPGQESPLSGAFLTINPLLTPEEAKQMSGERDPLLLKINSGELSLLQNEGRLTILVAAFQGNSKAFKFGEVDQSKLQNFEVSDRLHLAAFKAWAMAKYMRQKGVEAYVWHDHYRSIVTVGSFDSANDPRIRRVIEFYAPKTVADPRTGQPKKKYEYITIGRGPKAMTLPIDPNPRLVRVPKS